MVSDSDPNPSEFPVIEPLPADPTLSEPSVTPEAPSVTAQDFVPLDELIRTHAESRPEPEAPSDTGPIHHPELTLDTEPSVPIETHTAIPGADLPMAPGSDREFPHREFPDVLQKVREFSDSVIPSPPLVAAAFPFSLKIDGKLGVADRARLLDFLANENLGIRELDLEPQLESGRVLLPRISEYAGIAIVHLLRDSGARFQLGPAERVFAGQASEEREPLLTEGGSVVAHEGEARDGHLAEAIPVLAASVLPHGQGFTVLDSLSASGTLKANVVEFTKTGEFDEMVEALKKELRYKAFHRGATAVLQYSLQLSPLAVPTQYRLIASGVAVRKTDGATQSS